MCRFCVGNLFTNQSLFSGWSAPDADSLLRDGPSRRTFMALAGAAAGVAGLGLNSGRAFAQGGPADMIFQGGTVIPLATGGGAATAEAVAVRGGQIVAVGTEADIAGLKGDGTKVIDLAGRTLLPGFIDPHQHSCFMALFEELLTDVGYTSYPKRADLIAELKALDAKLPAGEWLLGYNFDNLLQGGDLSMAELDGISKDRPIFIWYINMHDAAANSAAFKIAAIPSDVGVLPGGGHFGRNPDGSFNGLVYEESAMLKFVTHAMPPITPQVFAKAMQDYFKASAALGYTATHEPGTVQAAWIEGLTKLTASGTGRLSASLMYDDLKSAEGYKNLGIGAKATLSRTRASLCSGSRSSATARTRPSPGPRPSPISTPRKRERPTTRRRTSRPWSPRSRRPASPCRSTATATPPSTTPSTRSRPPMAPTPRPASTASSTRPWRGRTSSSA